MELKTNSFPPIVYSDGFDNNATRAMVFRDNPLVNPNSQQFSTGASIGIRTTGTPDQQSAKITSMDSDGFTLTWTKTGSPTGTATIIYKANR